MGRSYRIFVVVWRYESTNQGATPSGGALAALGRALAGGSVIGSRGRSAGWEVRGLEIHAPDAREGAGARTGAAFGWCPLTPITRGRDNILTPWPAGEGSQRGLPEDAGGGGARAGTVPAVVGSSSTWSSQARIHARISWEVWTSAAAAATCSRSWRSDGRSTARRFFIPGPPTQSESHRT